VTIDFSKTQLPINSETTNSASRTRSSDSQTSTEASGASFEAQLSSALAESLQKLGVGAGSVDISIRNASANTRQIMVTYSIDGSNDGSSSGVESAPIASTATEIPAATPPAGRAAGELTNPFSGYIAHVPPVETPAESATAWAPYDGPRDVRDQIPEGGGKVTSTGAPLIVNNEEGAKNQYGYSGPATLNPYFTTPSNPLRDGYVMGFGNWFSNPMIVGGRTGPIPANKHQYSTEEGAQEALRIVEQFEPGATVVQSIWQSGPYSVDKPMFEIQLEDGRRLNAGGVLTSYYTMGHGVTTSSDETIRRSIQLA